MLIKRKLSFFLNKKIIGSKSDCNLRDWDFQSARHKGTRQHHFRKHQWHMTQETEGTNMTTENVTHSLTLSTFTSFKLTTVLSYVEAEEP